MEKDMKNNMEKNMEIGTTFNSIKEFLKIIENNGFSYAATVDYENDIDENDIDGNDIDGNDIDGNDIDGNDIDGNNIGDTDIDEMRNIDSEKNSKKIGDMSVIDESEIEDNSIIFIDLFKSNQYIETVIFQKNDYGYEIVAKCDVPLCD